MITLTTTCSKAEKSDTQAQRGKISTVFDDMEEEFR